MKTIEELEQTIAEMKNEIEEIREDGIKDLNGFVGEKLFIRTVTYFALGKVKKVMGKIIELEDACWVADTGRFSSFLKNGTTDELEITGRHFVNFDSVVDFFIWKHDLPTENK